MSSFNPSKLLPEKIPAFDEVALMPPDKPPHTPSNSSPAHSIFDNDPGYALDQTDPTHVTSRESSQDDQTGYDLRPPAPTVSRANGEALSDKLFSVEHLDLILRDQDLARPFKSFLESYRPMLVPTLSQYIGSQKAALAVQYANAIVEQMGTSRTSSRVVATLDSAFLSRSRQALEELITDALPAWTTHRMTQVVTECLVKEMTGSNAPIMRELVQGLAEVFCLTDPSMPDNPIVYASEGWL
jgi:hypothetical protein